jgi:hypothetical protein
LPLNGIKGRLLNSVSHAAISHALAGRAYYDASQVPANASVSLPTIIDENRTIDYATWTAMTASVRLPTGEFNVSRAIDCIDKLISMVRHRMEKKASRETIQKIIETLLRKGELDFAITTIAFADKGDELADAALRTVTGEIIGGALPERKPGHLQVLAYGQRALHRAPHERPPPGPRWHDKWMRNLLTCWLIFFADRDLDLRPSCNRERSHGKRARTPSGISLVVTALRRHGIDLDEANVQENIWFGLPGELVRADARRFASETGENSIL